MNLLSQPHLLGLFELFGSDVFVDDALNGAVGDEFLKSGVHFFKEIFIVFGNADGVIFHCVFGIENGEAFVGFHKSLSGLVVDDDAVDFAAEKSVHGVGAFVVAFDGIEA